MNQYFKEPDVDNNVLVEKKMTDEKNVVNMYFDHKENSKTDDIIIPLNLIYQHEHQIDQNNKLDSIKQMLHKFKSNTVVNVFNILEKYNKLFML